MKRLLQVLGIYCILVQIALLVRPSGRTPATDLKPYSAVGEYVSAGTEPG